MAISSEALLEEFGKFVATEVGLTFPPERRADLSRAIDAMVRENNFANPEQCMMSIMAQTSRKANVEMLARHLSIGETYFFRDPHMLNLLEQEVLLPLIATRRADGDRRLNIWSAGCCTGEETYTLAILIDRLIPDANNWVINILGTDINSAFLRKAKAGVYKEWSFRDVPSWIKQHYFSLRDKDHYELLPALRGHVKFECLNLADDQYPQYAGSMASMDIIVCRNVLMYFEIEQFRKAVKNLRAALVDGGCLIVSPIEGGQQMFREFLPMVFPGATFYRKTEKASVFDTRQSSIPISNEATALPTSDKFAQNKFVNAELPQAELVKRDIPIQVPVVAPEQTPVSIKDDSPQERAQQNYEQGNYREAVEILLANDCNDLRGLTLLAKASANCGELGAARRWVDEAIAVDKCDPKLRYLLAMIQEEQGQADEAIATLQRALYLDPNFVLAHFSLGALRLRTGKPRDAKRHHECVLALLAQKPPADIVPESDGITVGRLMQIIVDKEARL